MRTAAALLYTKHGYLLGSGFSFTIVPKLSPQSCLITLKHLSSSYRPILVTDHRVHNVDPSFARTQRSVPINTGCKGGDPPQNLSVEQPPDEQVRIRSGFPGPTLTFHVPHQQQLPLRFLLKDNVGTGCKRSSRFSPITDFVEHGSFAALQNAIRPPPFGPMIFEKNTNQLNDLNANKPPIPDHK